MFILENFRGWKREGEWGDISFLIEHDKDIAKIAVVGDKKWRDLVYAFLAKGFREAGVEFFGPDDLDKARRQSQDIDKIFRLAIVHPGRKEMESWSNPPLTPHALPLT